jgi:hypothetical protein
MKSTICVLALLLSSASAFAMDANMPSLTFPTQSGWAKAMVSEACGIELAKSDVGVIERAGKGVVYTVFNVNGDVLGQATAKSTSIFASKSCIRGA